MKNILNNLQNIGLTGNLKSSKYYRSLSEIQKKIHSEIPDMNYSKRYTAEVHIREEIFGGKNCKKIVAFLITNGCEWALGGANGCTMCGHLSKQALNGKRLSCNDIIKQFDDFYHNTNFSEYPIICLFNNGSFFNENEIPAEARYYMLEKINRNPLIEMMVVETRPEFVTEREMKITSEIMNDTYVEVAMGLEDWDDNVRTFCLNKGFTLQNFEKAAKTINEYLNLRCYVLLKPPFLTELESIRHSVETINKAISFGSKTIFLESCTVQNNTFVELLHSNGKYNSPWLWSIIEVIRKSQRADKLLIGLFQFFPSPKIVPYNCAKCSTRIIQSFKEYNKSLDISVLMEIGCECKDRWLDELQRAPVPFEQRYLKVLENIQGDIFR